MKYFVYIAFLIAGCYVSSTNADLKSVFGPDNSLHTALFNLGTPDINEPNTFPIKIVTSFYKLIRTITNRTIFFLNLLLIGLGSVPVRVIGHIVYTIGFPVRVILKFLNVLTLPVRLLLLPVRFIKKLAQIVLVPLQFVLYKILLLVKPKGIHLLPQIPHVKIHLRK